MKLWKFFLKLLNIVRHANDSSMPTNGSHSEIARKNECMVRVYTHTHTHTHTRGSAHARTHSTKCTHRLDQVHTQAHTSVSCVIVSVDPLAHVTQAYREQLLEKALYSLVTPGYQNNNIVGPNKGSDGYV